MTDGERGPGHGTRPPGCTFAVVPFRRTGDCGRPARPACPVAASSDCPFTARSSRGVAAHAERCHGWDALIDTLGRADSRGVRAFWNTPASGEWTQNRRYVLRCSATGQIAFTSSGWARAYFNSTKSAWSSVVPTFRAECSSASSTSCHPPGSQPRRSAPTYRARPPIRTV